MYKHFFKRLLDLIMSIGGILIFSPLFIGIAIAIKIDSKGPIFFRQERVGKKKKIFEILKFRTMYIDTPKDMPTHLLDNPDSYITRVGKFLRKTSLDELPQFFNIFSGKMAIIGPRPALYNQDDLISERDIYGANDIRPGLTGWAQINGRDELEIFHKAMLDGAYVQNISFCFDLKCFFGTISKVLKKDGVIEGAKTEKESHDKDRGITSSKEKNNKIKKVLITGAGSYIGNSLKDKLEKEPERYHVDVLDMTEENWRTCDFSFYDTVFHVAGIAHDLSKTKNKEIYYKVNRDLAIETAKKAKDSGVEQFIFMSSMSVYDGVKVRTITKNTAPFVKGVYGDSKLQAEIALRKLADEVVFKVAILRPPMIFGKGCKGNFPRLIRLGNKLPVFPRIKNQRSMLYIENLCEFVRMLVDSRKGGIYFPQNEDYFNTSEIIEIAKAKINKKMKFTKVFNPFIVFLKPISKTINKVFGNLTYDKTTSTYLDNRYQLVSNKESIERSI